MSQELIILPGGADELAKSSIEQFAEPASRYVKKGREGADATSRAYAGDWKRFTAFCVEFGRQPLPADVVTVAAFVTYLAEEGKKVATVQRHLASINKYHYLQNLPSPTPAQQLKDLLKGILREKGSRQKQADAFPLQEFKRVVRSIDTSKPKGLRDRALLLLGFAGAFRRQELSNLDLDDLQFTAGELIVQLKRSKTNQTGEAEEKAIFYSPDMETCPLRTLQQWVDYLRGQGQETGPVFRSFRLGGRGSHTLTQRRLHPTAINKIVQAWLGETYSAHSLRASFVTVAKLNGAEDSEVMNQTKHKTPAMIRRYTRLDNVTQHNAGKKLGL
ncbi:tyrosine-type recombinase/integrase [Hymenobacter endophyticus]|uniref:Tyrosine-type recombinase/integrase n=1 Tax=Hymenobacter endophyticus TaxID=3076335 RepID=A0ABU3TLC2_9BACT|nr:tyrosine-type recombinase/integrase [Hymenobacter endophyticus]MDU0372132.1 tyrosine-type recombinase/integrase [Hymenobacter endophyticus]